MRTMCLALCLCVSSLSMADDVQSVVSQLQTRSQDDQQVDAYERELQRIVNEMGIDEDTLRTVLDNSSVKQKRYLKDFDYAINACQRVYEQSQRAASNKQRFEMIRNRLARYLGALLPAYICCPDAVMDLACWRDTFEIGRNRETASIIAYLALLTGIAAFEWYDVSQAFAVDAAEQEQQTALRELEKVIQFHQIQQQAAAEQAQAGAVEDNA